VGALVVAVFLRPSEPPVPGGPEGAGAGPSSTARTPVAGGDPRKPSSKSPATGAEDQAAEELYRAAGAFGAAHVGEPEAVAAKYLEVYHLHPTTPSGKKAELKAREALASLEQSMERELEGLRKDAQTLAAAGRTLDAIQGLRDYLKGHPKEFLSRRVEREIALLENRCREAWNRTAQEAGALAQKQAYGEAVLLFRRLREGAILEVSTRCDEAIAQLAEAKTAFDDFTARRENEEALTAFRDGPAARALAHFRARRYEEGLKELDSPTGALKDLVARDRDAAQEARAFWDGFLKAVRARSVQELAFAPASPQDLRTVGKLQRIGTDRLVLDTGEASAEIPFEKVALDQVVAWTIGKTLPLEDPGTYVKAALFFFLDGHDDLARTYLATAKEMGADIREPERVFREGLLRSVSEKNKDPK
jgi:hypothetical protein